jgi:hypothetical protein
MPITEIKRPNYYEGQYLGAQDLVAAQEYQRQQDQRHRLAAHTWGIAVGLELEERPQPGSSDAVDVYLKPGYAVDGFGHAIVVLTPYKISQALFAQFTFDQALADGRWISVWLRYREEKTNPPRPGFAVCDIADQAYRILETFRVVVGDMSSIAQQHDQVSVAGQMVDAESEIPDASLPYQALPESDDAARWLIRLGSVRWLAPNPPATTSGHFVKSESDDEKKKAGEGRPYIGAVAESLLAPAGKLRIRDRHKAAGFVAAETQDLAAVEGSLRIDEDLHVRGKVGIGTMTPEQSLSTTAGLNIDQANANDGKLEPGITFGSQSGEGIASKRTSGGNEKGLDFYTGTTARLSITKDGNVGIGTASADRSLTVQGVAGTYLNVKADIGVHEVLLGADVNGGIVSTMTNHDLQLRAGGNVTRMTIQAGGNVGIGTTDPTLKLDIQGDFGGDGPTTLHLFASRIGDVGAGILFLRSGGGVVAFDGPDNIGIGTSNPGFKLDVAGPAHASSFPSSSDDRLKTNVTPLSGVLEKVRKIRGVSFDWNQKYAALGRSTNKRELGVLANEVKAVFPELVSTWGDENYLAVDYGRLTTVLLEAVKELTSEIEVLRRRIVALEKPAKKPGRKSNSNPLG